MEPYHIRGIAEEVSAATKREENGTSFCFLSFQQNEVDVWAKQARTMACGARLFPPVLSFQQ